MPDSLHTYHKPFKRINACVPQGELQPESALCGRERAATASREC